MLLGGGSEGDNMLIDCCAHSQHSLELSSVTTASVSALAVMYYCRLPRSVVCGTC